jgi:hypothetical protein
MSIDWVDPPRLNVAEGSGDRGRLSETFSEKRLFDSGVTYHFVRASPGR